MFLPLSDSPNLRGTPWVTWSLIALNVAIHLLWSFPLSLARPNLADPLLSEYLYSLGARGPVSVADILEHISAYDLFVFRYGFIPADFESHRLFTALFLHAGWMHLSGNMLFLWIFGDNIELRLGRVRFLLAYLATGIASTLFFTLFVPDSGIPLIGASGAISGVLGFYFLLFPRNQVKTFVFLFPFIVTTVLIPARWVLGFYLLVDNLLPFVMTAGGADAGVAYGAHIGGFIAGLAGARFFDRPPGPASDSREGAGEDSLSRLIRKRLWPEAVELYVAKDSFELRREMSDDNLLMLGEYLLRRRRFDDAARLYRRFIAERPASARLAEAYLGAARTLLGLGGHEEAARQYLLAVLDTAKERSLMREARKLLAGIEG